MRVSPRRLLAAALVWPAAALAQNGVVRAAATAPTSVAAGATVDVPLVLDLTGAPGLAITTLTVKVAWDPTRLALALVNGLPSATASVVSTGSGEAALTLPLTNGAGVATTVATLRFQASPAASGASPVSLAVQSATDAGGQSALARLGAQSHALCVGGGAGGGLWGDVTGDDQVDILDAQQIARFVVGLTVADAARMQRLGDVTNDGTVDILDAQQVARYVVGLTASQRVAQTAPGACAALPPVASVRVTSSATTVTVGQTLTLTAAALDAAGAALPGRAITWQSANPALATVDAAGIVRGVATGTASVTALSEGRSSTATVSVQAAPTTLYQLTLAVAGTGGATGSVQSPTVSGCATTTGASVSCVRLVVAGTEIALTAVPDAGSLFDAWTGACTGATTTCRVSMTQARSVTATFKPDTVGVLALRLSASGPNAVAFVGSTNDGAKAVNCAGDGRDSLKTCVSRVPTGTTLTLAANPGGYTAFVGWEGACTSVQLTCTVTVRGTVNLSARFANPRVPVIVSAPAFVGSDGAGTGNGRVRLWEVTTLPVQFEDVPRVREIGSCVIRRTATVGNCSYDAFVGSLVEFEPEPEPATSTVGNRSNSSSTFNSLPPCATLLGRRCARIVPMGGLSPTAPFYSTASALLTVQVVVLNNRVAGTADPYVMSTFRTDAFGSGPRIFCEYRYQDTAGPRCSGYFGLNDLFVLDAVPPADGRMRFVRWEGACATETTKRCDLGFTAAATVRAVFEVTP